jgi:hypothetical protein
LEVRAMLRAVLAGVIAAAVLAGAAQADVVHLKSGERLHGTVETKGDVLVVTNRYGSTAVPVSSVKLIEETPSILAEYGQAARGASPADIGAQRRLADFCREKGMTSEERYHLLLVLRLRPGDMEARSRLGYVRHRGEWVTKSEEMYDRGLVKFRGEWVTPAAKEAILLEEEKSKEEQLARKRKEREERLAALREKRLTQQRQARRERESPGCLGLTYASDPYYRSDYYGYPYGYGYSITAPYYGGYPYYGRLPQEWVWYRRWTGHGLSGSYKSGGWRVTWGR